MHLELPFNFDFTGCVVAQEPFELVHVELVAVIYLARVRVGICQSQDGWHLLDSKLLKELGVVLLSDLPEDELVLVGLGQALKKCNRVLLVRE